MSTLQCPFSPASPNSKRPSPVSSGSTCSEWPNTFHGCPSLTIRVPSRTKLPTHTQFVDCCFLSRTFVCHVPVCLWASIFGSGGLLSFSCAYNPAFHNNALCIIIPQLTLPCAICVTFPRRKDIDELRLNEPLPPIVNREGQARSLERFHPHFK
jgi:hypothetical protein